jgi:hypothetical protein
MNRRGSRLRSRVHLSERVLTTTDTMYNFMGWLGFCKSGWRFGFVNKTGVSAPDGIMARRSVLGNYINGT